MIKKMTIIWALVFLLTACTGNSAREIFGVGKAAPDEFAVAPNAPLTIPPDYRLTPPKPGSERPQTRAVREEARAAVLPSSGGETEKSDVEQILLNQTGAQNAAPDIRATIDYETNQRIHTDENITDKILFWREPPPPGVVVDPVAEKERIEKNIEEGKPITEGETPVIDKKKSGIRLF